MTCENTPHIFLASDGHSALGSSLPAPLSRQVLPQHAGYASHEEPFYNAFPSSVLAKNEITRPPQVGMIGYDTRASIGNRQERDGWRQPKAKSNEKIPHGTLMSQEVEHKYHNPVPKTHDKIRADIFDGLMAVQSSVHSVTRQVGRLDERLDKMVSFLAGQVTSSEPSINAAEGDDSQQASASVFITGIHSAASAMEDELERPESTPHPALSFNQATPTGLVLSWPAIRKLIEHHLRREGIGYYENFSINHEQHRDVLKTHYGYEYSHPVMRFYDRIDYNDLEACSPLSSNGGDQSWNHTFPEQAHHKRNVLSWDRSCDFSELKVWLYVQSFKDNILNLHPIIKTQVVDGWVQQFLGTLLASDPRSAKPQLLGLQEVATTDSQMPKTTSTKRKRSPGAQPGARRPDRSINSALVLTILALGKFCYYHNGIPNVAYQKRCCPDSSPADRQSAVSLPSNQELSTGLSNLSSTAHPLLSGESQNIKTQSQSSFSHDEGIFPSYHCLERRLEDNRGFEYFAQATDIIGNHVGSYNSIKNVYFNIFAGLYHDQVDRPMESLAFILDASHKLQVIMRPSLGRMRDIKRDGELIQENKYNQLALAFWACLQLESDISNETPVPSSGLLSYEDGMPYPNMSLLTGFDQRILECYLGLIYLRTHFNTIHRILHTSQGLKEADRDVLKNIDLVSHDLSGMHWVPPSFTFREDDLPADDVLAARMRAGYWSLQIILYRPFLRQILHSSNLISNYPPTPASNNTASTFDIHQDTATYSVSHIAIKHDKTSPQILELARRAIKALIECCRAFHGLGNKRPIITNVFGTAHT
ncbi:hypothetical protein F25303_10012 [Fusarium sp. NRRL 25303]|nr:hypothetical protein F25303_10012 [Fusarium sp. NRRL 25303]